MREKIGIITFHDTTNFGSLLQTYGLYKKIVELGYECEVIDYQCESIVKRELPKKPSLKMSFKDLYRYIRYGSIKSKKYKELSRFLNEKMKLSRKCDRTTVKGIEQEYKKIVVGSDIVWGMDIIEGDTTYFLDFCDSSSKKTAFSSSIGNPWSENEKKIIKPLLNSFDYIAVREDESADWIEELIGKRPEVVCDPTMLITSEDWKNHTYKLAESNQYVLVYFDNKNGDCIKNAKAYASKHNLKVKYINYGKTLDGVENIKPISIEAFLSLINSAAFIVTASYHGMLFSIYFNRQFAYFNRAHKSRMNTLARKLKVTDREGGVNDVLQMPTIDYNVVNTAVEDNRQFSINCLKSLLSE